MVIKPINVAPAKKLKYVIIFVALAVIVGSVAGFITFNTTTVKTYYKGDIVIGDWVLNGFNTLNTPDGARAIPPVLCGTSRKPLNPC